MANGTDTIIIRGGSADVEFNPAKFPVDPTNPRKHGNASLKITRVVITGDISFDSGDVPGGLKCEITAFCR